MSCCLWLQGERGLVGQGRWGQLPGDGSRRGAARELGWDGSRAAAGQEEAWRPPQGEWRRGQGVKGLQRAAVALAKGGWDGCQLEV